LKVRRVVGVALVVVSIVLIIAGIVLIASVVFAPLSIPPPSSYHSHVFPYALVGLVLVILGLIMLTIGILLLVVKPKKG
jgi:uncharacterized membrane protein